jgi:hypothetical protein
VQNGLPPSSVRRPRRGLVCVPDGQPMTGRTPTMSDQPTPTIESLADTANREHACGDEATRQGLTHYLAAGNALIEAKRQVGHGGWVKWLKANVNFDRRSASNYILLASKWETVSHLDCLRDALKALARRDKSLAAAERVEYANRQRREAAGFNPPGWTCWRRAVWLGLVEQAAVEARGIKYSLRATVIVTADTDPKELEDLIRTDQVHWVLKNYRDKTLGFVRVEAVESLERFPSNGGRPCEVTCVQD